MEAPSDATFPTWIENLKKHNLQKNEKTIFLAYQKEEKGYHARSFEDAFININLDKIKQEQTHINGTKNIDKLDSETNIYSLTEEILDRKSDFASSVLFLALSKGIKWETPSYIKEGLLWMAK